MLNDDKGSHIKRAVFLPMYYTVISLMVMKSIFLTPPGAQEVALCVRVSVCVSL